MHQKKKMPEVVDLFSGCGGLALGFQSAGFHITHGIEIMKEAVETASYNLHWRFGEESQHICGDITALEPDIFKESIGKNGCIVIGGPPCQAYSLAGRAKLRSLGEERINTNDKRGFLYQDFLRFVVGLNARAVVMENVPESTNYGGKNIPQTVCELLDKEGYDAFWTILNSADFGVPQVRERVIVIGIKKDEQKTVNLPVPSHGNSTDRLTPNQMRFKTFAECANFRTPNNSNDDCTPWVTVEEAFSDLPELFPDERSKYILNKITVGMDYRTEPVCDYQNIMRTWYGYNERFVTANCFRKTLRDFPIFARMNPGSGYLEACEIADKLLEDACVSNRISAATDREAYEALKKKIVPPYDRNNFLNKWQKLCLDKPSHTLVAHLSVDTYSHIHPVEPRGISVREAARLQSFPDGYIFQCNMGEAYKQIGNAVPPLLAKAVATELYKTFSDGND